MGEFPRKSDGRRVFTVEFKRGIVQQPHSALGMRSPADYRALASASGELTPPSV